MMKIDNKHQIFSLFFHIEKKIRKIITSDSGFYLEGYWGVNKREQREKWVCSRVWTGK